VPALKRIAVLGSTGSIGTQTLDVVRAHPDRLEIVALAAKSNASLLDDQIAEFKVKRSALFERDGLRALSDLATLPEVDIVVVSVAGMVGILPTLDAIRAGKHIALASKEVLVAAGEVIMPAVREAGVTMTPIDSEHSAIFQCLQGYRPEDIDGLIVTASGGPFRGKKRSDLEQVTVEQALNHPTWRMGGKITIDSATLMNKALETIEARWLFDVPMSRVDAVIHPQSIIHSFVRFNDGSVLGQFGWPNMRLPIQLALLHPDRVPSGLPDWNPAESPDLTFEPIDHETFPALRLAQEAVNKGGTAPCAFNAANEETVAAFLRGDIGFLGIVDRVAEVVDRHDLGQGVPSLAAILDAEERARADARKLMRVGG
jgi:1-deoxy-D-xylulose-5-phosphate reductoisomerase